MRKYYFTVTLVFIFSILLGFWLVSINPELTSSIMSSVRDKFSSQQDATPANLFVFILINNALIALANIVFGILFGIIPLLVILMNGIIIGIIFGMTPTSAWPILFLGIAPHAIFEIPAFIISGVYGLWLGGKFISKLAKKEPFIPNFVIAIKKYFMVVLPLLMGAALIETYISANIIKNLTGN